MHYSEYIKRAVEITGERQREYSDVDDNFDAIAEIASALLGRAITRFEVAMILVAVKFGRLRANPAHEDSWSDAINYVAFSAQFAPRPPEPVYSAEGYMAPGSNHESNAPWMTGVQSELDKILNEGN
jgi:hypothetical protein